MSTSLSGVYAHIQNLRSLKGKAKLEYLQANAQDDTLRRFLFLTYGFAEHNFYVTGVDKNAGVLNLDDEDLNIQTLESYAKVLCNRNITGNAAKMHISGLWASGNAASRECIELMLKRDIEAGVAEATINKAWPGLLKIVPYMRCVLPKDGKPTEWEWDPANPHISDLKCDGMYANCDITRDGVSFTSRNGSVYPLSEFGGLVQELQQIPELVGKQLQGELLVYEIGSDKPLPREQSNGKMNSVLQDGDSLERNQFIRFVVWDMIPFSQAFHKNTYEIPLRVRRAQMEQILSSTSTLVRVVPYKLVGSYQEALEHNMQLVADGEEGTVLKHRDAPWLDGNNKQQIKLKVEAEVDLKLLGLNPSEKAKNADTFGSMQLGTGEDVPLLEVGCTGLTDSMRQYIHDNRDTLVGSAIITVKANGIMRATEPGKKHSLFLPRFTEIRADKKEADTFERVEAIFAGLVKKA